jgi:uncharacterized protein YjiK
VADQRRPLTAWERYRALTDAFDEGLDLVDLADHKARFAFVIMGALNVALYFILGRSEVAERIPPGLRSWLVVYLILYGLVGIYFFLQAIESLRPRSVRPRVPNTEEIDLEETPIGVRFFHDVLERDVLGHLKAWRSIHIGQLNAELARQAYALAHINRLKYAALNRLYKGLKVMTLLAAGLLLTIEGGLVVQDAMERVLAAPAGEREAPALDILPEPERIAESGVREPSGIAYHAALQRLFVVGDDGRLAELNQDGAVLRTDPFKGNLEDLAVHTPSGDLVLLSEKKSELVIYDPLARKEKRHIRMDAEELLGQEPEDANEGFEGIAFREAADRPGGGIFYLAHQRSPAMVVAVAFDPETTADRLGEWAVVRRWRHRGYKDFTAVIYVSAIDRLLVLTDSKDRLAVVRPEEAELEADIALAGRQQEGICFDGDGDLWVADEKSGLLRFRGALAAVSRALSPTGERP